MDLGGSGDSAPEQALKQFSTEEQPTANVFEAVINSVRNGDVFLGSYVAHYSGVLDLGALYIHSHCLYCTEFKYWTSLHIGRVPSGLENTPCSHNNSIKKIFHILKTSTVSVCCCACEAGLLTACLNNSVKASGMGNFGCFFRSLPQILRGIAFCHLLYVSEFNSQTLSVVVSISGHTTTEHIHVKWNM